MSTLMPAALAKVGLEPTAVMAVPVLVCRKTHIRNASRAKNSRLPVAREMNPQFGLPTRRTFERYMGMTAQEYAELRYPTLLSARDERHVQTVLAYRNEVREWSIERLMEAEKNFFAKCGRLPEPYEYTAENGLPMYSVFCRLAKEAFEEIIRAQFLETQELSGPVLTM